MDEGPLKHYRELCQADEIKSDASQLAALEKLQIFHNRLKQNKESSGFSLLSLPKRLLSKEEDKSFIGLYLYGGVGRGKSLLMDLFFDSCQVEKKWRVHFHVFMQTVHKKLKETKEKLGSKHSHYLVDVVAKELAKEYHLICFDEFYVSDIVNAMILSKLFSALIEQNVCFVLTSNFAPKDLYQDGLQRELFEPFIDLIYDRFEIHHLDGEKDFRRQHDIVLRAFIKVSAKAANVFFNYILASISKKISFKSKKIKLLGQNIFIRKQTDLIAWFECDELAEMPRGIKEFEYYAKHYKLIFLQDIPMFLERGKDYTRRFMNFIDVIYDARVKLIFSSIYDIDQLEVHETLQFEFERTKSRLFEMQDMNYENDKIIEVSSYYESK